MHCFKVHILLFATLVLLSLANGLPANKWKTRGEIRNVQDQEVEDRIIKFRNMNNHIAKMKEERKQSRNLVTNALLCMKIKMAQCEAKKLGKQLHEGVGLGHITRIAKPEDAPIRVGVIHSHSRLSRPHSLVESSPASSPKIPPQIRQRSHSAGGTPDQASRPMFDPSPPPSSNSHDFTWA